MRRRLFRRASRVAGAAALVSGVTGIIANGLLILYFALARPWGSSHSGPWEWMGPANDIVGSISMALLIPAVVSLGSRLRADRLLVPLGVAGAMGMGALAAAGPLLVAGRISLETQFLVAGLALPAVFGWLLRVNRTGRLTGLLPAGLARFGERIGLAALLGTALAALGLVFPMGSAAQYVILGLAAIPGLPAYLALPVWPILLGRWLSRGPGQPTSSSRRGRAGAPLGATS
jgi:hypothetical protein